MRRIDHEMGDLEMESVQSQLMIQALRKKCYPSFIWIFSIIKVPAFFCNLGKVKKWVLPKLKNLVLIQIG